MILKLYPVCKCGYVFKELKCFKNVSYIDENRCGKILIKNVVFSPRKCPKCGELIEGVEIEDFLE